MAHIDRIRRGNGVPLGRRIVISSPANRPEARCLGHRSGAKADGIRRQMRRSDDHGSRLRRSKGDGRQSIFFHDHLLLITAVPDDQLSEPSSAGHRHNLRLRYQRCPRPRRGLRTPVCGRGFRVRACRGIGAARPQMIDQVWRS
jgi:hypothetical protein